MKPIVLYHPGGDHPTLPLGLVHLGSLFRDRRVTIVDGRVELAPEAQVVALCREAVCLGVTVRTGAPIQDALRICHAARAASPGLPVIWGGWHPSLLPGQCLSSAAVDACVVGQGEGAFAAAVHVLEERGSLHEVSGLVWRSGDGDVVRNPPGFFADVNGLPRANFGLLDLERYFQARGSRRLDYCTSQTDAFPGAGREPAWSGLCAERVVEEVRDLARGHKLSEVCFRDEDFFHDARRLEAIAQSLLEGKGRVSWSGAGRIDSLRRLSDDQLGLLKASGCRRVGVGVEAGRPGTAEKGRGEVLELAERLRGAGLGMRVSFLAGNPGEPRERLREVYRTAKAIREIDGSFETPLYLYAPYPGPPEPGPEASPAASTLEEWSQIDLDSAPGPPKLLSKRVSRYNFYLDQAYRPPGRRWGKRLVHALARARVRLGFFGLDLERRAVLWVAEARTGRDRPRRPAAED
ncbi:MAG TPA: cobalamin-dependent protein [Vicinamibacteria bacterium]|nr:cobalamin-dependent protein [Vicinamibacteria bacterium]